MAMDDCLAVLQVAKEKVEMGGVSGKMRWHRWHGTGDKTRRELDGRPISAITD